jgi:hypothetical protein
MEPIKHTVIIDQIGRTILGVQTGDTENTLTLSNPIILHFQPSQNGQLELQVYPLFFFELLNKDTRDKNSWTYSKTAITMSNVELNPEILARYEQINTPPVKAASPKVISIDDI